jgi:tetratricopeptide (TPR) repeat protein
MGFWEWREAERRFDRALRLNPRSAHVHTSWSGLLVQLGRPAEALTMARTGVELDPLVPTWHWHLAFVHYFKGEYAEAVASARTAATLDPANFLAPAFEGLALLELEERNAAIAAFERALQLSGDVTFVLGNLGGGLARAGLRDDAQKVLETLLDRPATVTGRSVSVASVYFGMGDRDEGFEWLDRAVEEHDPQLAFAIRGLDLQGIRDPRLEAIRQRVFAR